MKPSNHKLSDQISGIVQKRPSKKVAIEWYDGGIKALLYFNEVRSWFYFSLVGINHVNAQKAFSYTRVTNQQLLSSVITVKEGGEVFLNEELQHGKLLARLDDYLKARLDRKVVISTEILDGFTEQKTLKSPPIIIEWEEILSNSHDFNQIFSKPCKHNG